MEGLSSGWVKGDISGTYHYIGGNISGDNIATAVCGFKTRQYLDFLKKYEILDTSKICTKCELIRITISANQKKKYQFITSITPIQFWDNHVLTPVICSENGCVKSGAAYVSIGTEEKPHYCIKHNPLIPHKLEKEITL